MKEYTVRGFADEHKVSIPTARRYLNRLVKDGKPKAGQKPLWINYYGKDVKTKRMVTIYRTGKAGTRVKGWKAS